MTNKNPKNIIHFNLNRQISYSYKFNSKSKLMNGSNSQHSPTQIMNGKRTSEDVPRPPPAKRDKQLREPPKLTNLLKQVRQITTNSTTTLPIKTQTSTITEQPSTSKQNIVNNSSSISSTHTVHNNDVVELSPSTAARLFSQACTADNLPSQENVNAIPPPISGTIKPETTTSNIQSTNNNTNRSERHKQLKNNGRIEISMHGTDVYTNDELVCILHTLRAKKAKRIGPNLVRAELLTGTYTHASQIGYQMNLTQDQEELGSLIDQATQANGTQIDNEIHDLHTQTWQPLVTIPELTENKEIVRSTHKPAEIIFNPRAFINYTRYPIPEDIAVILSMGPKFAVPVYNSDKDFETLKDTAYTLNEIYGHPEGKAEVRANIVKYIDDFKNNQKAYRTEQKDYFHNAIKATKQFINEHPDIIATQSDKARASILMDRKVYIDKVENLLRDKTTYQALKTTSTRSYLKMNEMLLKRMVDLKLISKEEMSRAIAHETTPANLYGLLKNHKKDTPIRPIVNTRNSMGYLASTKATEILTAARDTGLKFNVLNSRDACAKLKQTKILPDEIVVSLDIKSMFTNITAQKAITSVRKRQKQLRMSDGMMQLMVDIIKFVCIQSTEIMFNNNLYKQIKGLRMGSSLSPILADFVVEDMLETAFLTIERPKLLMKYVDDILCVLEASEAENIQQALNNCDPHIQFEMEKEVNGKINYLDVTVYRDECDLKTIWYQKHISSGLFLNYHSNHPRTTIRNTAIQYVVTMIMNTHTDHHDSIVETAMDRLTRNSYPSGIAKEIIQQAKGKIAQKQMGSQYTATQDNEPSISYTRPIEFIPHVTTKIQRDIVESHKKQGDDRNIQIPATPMHTMNQKVYNPHKKTNAKFVLEEHEEEGQIDLTQPGTSNANT